ncbi:MAG: 1-aminocyclopropane-carboxylate deaminase [Acidimicrobiaceae bacterium]|jgi:1-aminocyclopropane-1-carboxylate deaminase
MAAASEGDPLSALCRLPTPLVHIEDGLLSRRGVDLWLKLEGESHPQFGGNKLRKLAPNLELALRSGAHRVIAFGIGRSTFLFAVASACRELGLQSVGIVEESRHSARALARLRALGMELIDVPSAVYRRAAPMGRVDLVRAKVPDGYVLPEGGSNPTGIANCGAIVREIDIDVDLITTPMGTGGTLAGLALGAAGRARVLGFTALQGQDYDVDRVHRFTEAAGGEDPRNWDVCLDYHSRQLPDMRVRSFMRAFQQAHGIELDTRYNGKSMYGLWDLIERGEIARGTRVVAVHTGGLETGENRLPPEAEIEHRVPARRTYRARLARKVVRVARRR